MRDSSFYRRLDQKIDAIKSKFTPLLHNNFVRFEIAELRHDDGTWDAWLDLPVRLYSGRDVVSISWWNFDDLWLANDETSPFSAEGLEGLGVRALLKNACVW